MDKPPQFLFFDQGKAFVMVSSGCFDLSANILMLVIRHFVERHFVDRAISSKRLFVEVSFCRMSTSSKQVFVEYSRRNILCSLGGHIVSADPVTMYHVIVRLRTLAKFTGLKLTISFY